MNSAYYSDKTTQFLRLNLLHDLREDVSRGTPEFPGCAYVCELHKLPEGTFPYHWHEELQFTRAVDRVLELKVNGDTIRLQPGEGIFINSSVLHSIFTRETAPCERRDIIFHAELLYGSTRTAVYRNYILPLLQARSVPCVVFRGNEPFGSSALSKFEAAFSAMKEQPYGFEIMARRELTDLCLAICGRYQSEISTSSAFHGAEETRVRAMVDYIYKNYSRPLSVSQIAGAANVSVRECHRAFRGILNTTPVDFLRKHRISAAKVLLAESDLTVQEIGERCGFADPAYFSRAFRQIAGTGPAAYRAEVK